MLGSRYSPALLTRMPGKRRFSDASLAPPAVIVEDLKVPAATSRTLSERLSNWAGQQASRLRLMSSSGRGGPGVTFRGTSSEKYATVATRGN